MFDKQDKVNPWRKGSLFNKLLGKSDRQNYETRPLSYTLYKNQLTMNQNLNLQSDAIK